MNNRRWPWLIALIVFLLDRGTKIASFSLPPEGVTLIPGVVRLRFVENRGIAFSLLSGVPWLLGCVSLAIIIGMLLVLRKKTLAPLPLVGSMLMLGGAAGNMVDRFFLGYVPDMIELLFVNFAIFNMADACLTVGCALLIWSLLFRPRDWQGA